MLWGYYLSWSSPQLSLGLVHSTHEESMAGRKGIVFHHPSVVERRAMNLGFLLSGLSTSSGVIIRTNNGLFGRDSSGSKISSNQHNPMTSSNYFFLLPRVWRKSQCFCPTPTPISVSSENSDYRLGKGCFCAVLRAQNLGSREEGSYPASTTSWQCVSGQAPCPQGHTSK